MPAKSQNRRRPRGRSTSTPRPAQRDPERDITPEELEALGSASGILHVLPDGYGFLRVEGYVPSKRDVYVSRSQIQRLGLRSGDLITGLVRPPKEGSKESYAALVRVDEVEGEAPDKLDERPEFEKLPAPSPNELIKLEHDPRVASARIIDLLAPIGKGQRGLVVAPPKAGKTTVLREIAAGVVANHPEIHLIALLVDERPEEAFDWEDTLGENAEVVASTFDRPLPEHLDTAELVLERAKRLVERGRDVMILLDSLTRMARTYNQAAPASGRILSGGVESTALDPPKRFFGSARNVKGDGSLTIIASCLVETESRMDQVIFEEFKGRGNMEVRLDRALAERRLFPAINVEPSGTRKEELLIDADDLKEIWKLRRALHSIPPQEALQVLLKNIEQTKTNAEFIKQVAKRTA
jgi:transcription termination factor Rho